MIEEWKDIQGYEGLYQVSNLGNVKNLERIVKCKLQKTKTIKEHLLKKSVNKFGYEYVCLSNDSITRKIKVHRLVAQAFIPNPLNKPQVNHINGIKTDNKVENLEWCNNQENMAHAIKNGLWKGRRKNGDNK